MRAENQLSSLSNFAFLVSIHATYSSISISFQGLILSVSSDMEQLNV